MNLEMIEAGWLSLLPPLIAITLALISKEVYSSLFLGVLTGMGVYCFLTGGNVLQAVTYAFDMIAAKIGENGYMIIFLVLLGSLVVVVTRSGGSNAYGQWAGKRIKNKVSAKLATALLGLLIFVDDGFNCLTVGTVMRPITDKCRISREKLAYLLDATAAPICIIAPISSWAVAVAPLTSVKMTGTSCSRTSSVISTISRALASLPASSSMLARRFSPNALAKYWKPS